MNIRINRTFIFIKFYIAVCGASFVVVYILLILDYIIIIKGGILYVYN